MESLSVCHALLVPSVLHSCGPSPRRSSPWTLVRALHFAFFFSLTRSSRAGGWVAGNVVDPAAHKAGSSPVHKMNAKS